MSNSKVIKMNIPNSDMGKKIEQAKAKAEAAYQEKLEKSRASDIDVRDFFTDEELDRILSDNEFFSGKIADLTAVQRYEKVKQAALWLDANSLEVVKVDIEPISRTRPNVTISIEIRRLASLRGKELRVFSAMSILSDTVFLSGVKDATIRFTFGLEGVWQ